MTSGFDAAGRDRVQDALALGEVHQALGLNDLPQAIALARAALEDGLRDPLLYNLVAFDLEQQGRLAEAQAQLEQAFRMAPRDPLILNAIGENFTKQGRVDDALKAYDLALAIEPNLAQALYNKAEALALGEDFAGARACCERALEINPSFAAPMATLAWLMHQDGEPARGLAERALSLDPHQAMASLVLAELDSREGLVDAVGARLAASLSQPHVPPILRARATGYYADALDRQGRAAEAFAAYQAGNEILLRLHGPQYAAPGMPTVLEMAQWLDQSFAAADPAQWTSAPPAGPPGADEPSRHVFLVGFPRSGTTLLEQILVSHPEVIHLDEREILAEIGRDLFVTDEGLRRLAMLEADEAERRRAAYWRRARDFHPDLAGKLFLDKLPLNTIQLPLIAKLFPRAKVLFAKRDPRDVVLSCFRRRFGMNPAMFQFLTLEGAAAYYDAAMTLAERYRGLLPLTIQDIRYEALVADFEAEVRAICAFVGLEWDPAMLDFAAQAQGRDIRTPSARQVRRGLYAEGAGQWRPYAEQLAPVAPLLEPWVRRFGYEA